MRGVLRAAVVNCLASQPTPLYIYSANHGQGSLRLMASRVLRQPQLAGADTGTSKSPAPRTVTGARSLSSPFQPAISSANNPRTLSRTFIRPVSSPSDVDEPHQLPSSAPGRRPVIYNPAVDPGSFPAFGARRLPHSLPTPAPIPRGNRSIIDELESLPIFKVAGETSELHHHGHEKHRSRKEAREGEHHKREAAAKHRHEHKGEENHRRKHGEA